MSMRFLCKRMTEEVNLVEHLRRLSWNCRTKFTYQLFSNCMMQVQRAHNQGWKNENENFQPREKREREFLTLTRSGIAFREYSHSSETSSAFYTTTACTFYDDLVFVDSNGHASILDKLKDLKSWWKAPKGSYTCFQLKLSMNHVWNSVLNNFFSIAKLFTLILKPIDSIKNHSKSLGSSQSTFGPLPFGQNW